ncbi:hypothetical protein V1514DRAFT_331223 [Lipomyces japonicus]|uniref:uncharacterized protein n=1 Tax=Lipomyces japonicus TaxID=56871 RepID=UPI0034CF1850
MRMHVLTIPQPKYCPVRLSLWKNHPLRQQEVYSSVCNYFQPTEENLKRLYQAAEILKILVKTTVIVR